MYGYAPRTEGAEARYLGRGLYWHGPPARCDEWGTSPVTHPVCDRVPHGYSRRRTSATAVKSRASSKDGGQVAPGICRLRVNTPLSPKSDESVPMPEPISPLLEVDLPRELRRFGGPCGCSRGKTIFGGDYARVSVGSMGIRPGEGGRPSWSPQPKTPCANADQASLAKRDAHAREVRSRLGLAVGPKLRGTRCRIPPGQTP